MGAQSFPNLTTPGTTSTVTMSTSSVTSSSNVATATTVLSVGQSLSNTLTTSLTSTSSESDTGQEAEYSLYGKLQYEGCVLAFDVCYICHPCALSLVIWELKVRSHFVVLGGLKLCNWTGLKLKESTCPCLLSAGI